MQIKVGSYAGDATDDRPITGIGFQPDFVLIKGNNATNGACKFASMAGDLAFALAIAAAPTTNLIQSLDSDGFTVGNSTSVNANLITNYYLAVRDNGAGDFTYGSYSGDGVDGRSITVGFQPDCIIVKQSIASEAKFRTSGHSGDISSAFLTNSADAANLVESLTATGFTVGTALNTSGNTYYWAAFKNTDGLFKAATYVGDGVDGRDVTGVGFEPDFVIVKSEAAQYGVIRSNAHVGDSSAPVNQGSLTDRIQGFLADGFDLGTNIQVNSNTVDYYYIAFQDGTSSSGTLDMWYAGVSQPRPGEGSYEAVGYR